MTMSTRKILYSFVVLLSLRIGVKGPPIKGTPVRFRGDPSNQQSFRRYTLKGTGIFFVCGPDSP